MKHELYRDSLVDRETPVIATHQRERRVRWADTDATGNATLPSLIRMMEETEYSFLRSRGLRVVLHDDRGIIGFPRLSASIQVHNSVQFESQVRITLELVNVDGKEIHYQFSMVDEDETLVAEGRFEIATCRFPAGDWPYAILTPEFVIKKLTSA